MHDALYTETPISQDMAIGTLRRVLYKDGAVFTYRVIEISELRHRIVFDLIHVDASIQVSGVMHTIELKPVTESNQTFLTWRTEFSGDCNFNLIQDSKFKKLDAFKDMRKSLNLINWSSFTFL